MTWAKSPICLSFALAKHHHLSQILNGLGNTRVYRMGLESDIEIRLLGLPELVRPGGAVIFPAKGFQLLALLARAPSKRLPRKELAALLWDNDTEAAALGNLRQLLARVRKAGGAHDDLLDADTKTVALGGGAALIDLSLFEIGYRSGSPEQALRGLLLFRGELLEGITETTDAFSHWLMVERAALRERFFSAASSILIELTRFGRASEQDLRAVADRMLALDPEREASYRSLIEAYGRNGMHEEAERTYRQLIAMLEREFGVPPQPETAAVLRRVLASRGHQPGDLAQAKPQKAQPRVAFMAPTWIMPAGDPGQSALLRALVEDIANELARYRSFVTLAPHSSFKLAHDSGVPLDNSVLRADYTVSGFVKPSEREQLLVLRMADCQNGEILWAGEFSFRPEELVRSFRLLSLQVASTVANSVERHLLDVMRRDGNNQAYLHYLDGQELLKNSDLPRLRRARRSFQQAIDLNNGMALAHARIAQTLYLEWLALGGNDPEILRHGRESAELAAKIDPGAGFTHLMCGSVALYQRDFDYSAEKFAEAEALSPNSADFLVQHADALSCFGEENAGWAHFERAVDLNPFAPDHYWWAGASILVQKKDFAGAIELCAKMASENSVLRILTACHAHLGNRSEARAYWRRFQELYPDTDPASAVKLAPFKHESSKQTVLDGLRMAEH
ncbi:BTAD domain-containing putative transcriptional regulator [Dongia rigui]|uniref:BTAD domain-containing putative transcriptional regulator n=1 Tax=Dongia rigui TaxID=940149 RepID=A0ABU5DZG9_9PROT|nr:BTAD domain-containing putative transcriptional regulator [Dongia rigui]MDY0872696.1 BTAD domain-containing putative transcriptional regulator [Dongia rigui]